jgi:phosphinothricin acetyltransferase
MSEVIHLGERHLPAILDIYNDAIVNTTALYDYQPRTLDMMKDWLAKKRVGNYPILGIETADGVLTGFASYGPFRPHAAYQYSIEHSVYVQRDHRGRGLGKVLMRALIAAAEAQDYHTMIGVIDASNAASIEFHRQLGFTEGGTLRHVGYKFGLWLDIVFYQLLLSTPERPVEK